MTACTTLNEHTQLESQNNKNINAIKNATLAIKNEFANCYTTKQDEGFIEDYEKILNLTALSIKMYANSYYKDSAAIEPNEIDQIKKSLSNYVNNNEKTDAFKKELIQDLSEFQKQIKTKHVQQISDLIKEKQFCEKEIRVLDFEKNKLIMERLSKIVWPYDQKTKEYDNKIAQLQIRLQKLTTKIENQQNMRPMANEKDILLYKMHLKEKFANKK